MRFVSRLFAPAALAVGLCLVATPMIEAARGGGGGGGGRGGGGGGGRGFGGGGRGFGGGYGRGGYGGYGYGGYGGWGYGGFYPWFGLDYGYGGFGYPDYGYGGYSYAPSYGATYYSTPYVYSSPYNGPVVTYYGTGTGPTTQQSAYYNPAQSNLATVEVRVPPDATVFFDGSKTKMTGNDRVFESPPLEAGKTYTYEVKAQWMKDGKPIEKTQTLQVRAGQRSMADFTLR